MAVIDVEALLQPISEDAPCGPVLEYDPAYAEMERAARGRPERQMGEVVVAEEPPDWRAVKRQATNLFARTKDLRIAGYLVKSLLHTDGLPGFASGMFLVQGLLERYWEPVHPVLDPEEGNDPTFRVNTLLELCDPDTTLPALREAPLVDSRALGRFSLRDVLMARGDVPVPSGLETPPEAGAVEAAFLGCEMEALQETSGAVAETLGHVAAIDALLTDKVGSARAPGFGALVSTLKAIEAILKEKLAARGAGEGGGAEGEGAAGATGGRAIGGQIRSRDDVVRVLDLACEYFRRHEPSSPVPLLLTRAKRLVAKDFMDIVRDLAPDALTQIELIRGGKSEDS